MRQVRPVTFGWSPDCLGEEELRALLAAYLAGGIAGKALPKDIVTIIDARGQRCPYPVMELRSQMERLRAGEQVILLADDPLARLDVDHAVRQAGDHLRQRATLEGLEGFLVERSAARD